MPQGHGNAGYGEGLGPGNTNVRVLGGYYPFLPTQLYPTPGTPRTAPRRSPPDCTLVVSPEHAHMTVLSRPKEILGVYNAQVHQGTVRARYGLCRHWRHLTPVALRPLPVRP